MTMAQSRPSCSTRPAYLDNLFKDCPPLPTPQHSANSSFSTASSSGLDLRLNKPLPRPLTPAFEEYTDDQVSLRSFGSRFTFRNPFNRRTYPSTKWTPQPAARPPPSPPHCQPGSRRPSLPRLTTTFSSPSLRMVMEKEREKPLPLAPVCVAQELGCHRCYYFAARNCHGWVMGGSHGDACEQCLQAGFFGAP
ncbi:hypothetical protein LTR02_003350 [Friedmanniomyces endolithicus]|nr:hypothetical protein LTR02_003350 [Friedmanniomyces endolithicus]